MTDFGLFTLFLFLHIFSAIVAFGPTFVFPIIGSMNAKEPAHGNYGARITEAVTNRLVIPIALSMPVTGLFLIWFGHVNLADRTGWWLDIAIVLYVVLVSIGIAVQRPTVMRLVQLTSVPPPGAGAGGPPAAGGPPSAGGPPGAGGPPPGGRPAGGPPPALLAAVRKSRRNGAVMGILIVVIVLLMVVRPQF